MFSWLKHFRSSFAWFIRRQWALFCSLKLTLVVLILLLFSLFVGMFWDQTKTLDMHLASLEPGSVWETVFVSLELYDVFHSWWFSVLVLLLALNLIACSVERLPRIWIEIRNPERHLTAALYARLPHKQAVLLPSLEQCQKWVQKAWGVQLKQHADGNWYVFYEKHPYARCGVYVIHTALLLMMFGSIVATNWGVDGLMMIEEGEKSRIVRARGPGGMPYFYDLGFDVRCRDFRFKSFVDGSPLAFESDLVIEDPRAGTQRIPAQTVRVNQPLHYNGYTFYQSSYQMLEGQEIVHLGLAWHGESPKSYRTLMGSAVRLGPQTVVTPLLAVEDYGGLGPALKVEEIHKGKSNTFFVFRSYPDFDFKVRRGPVDVFYRGMDGRYATGISVGYVPGISAVFFGFVLMVIGLWMAFAMSHRLYYARAAKREDGYEFWVAGISKRHRHAFLEEFNELASNLEQIAKRSG